MFCFSLSMLFCFTIPCFVGWVALIFTKIYIGLLRLWKISRLVLLRWQHDRNSGLVPILFHRPQRLAPIEAVVRRFWSAAHWNGHGCCEPDVDWPISIRAISLQDARLHLKICRKLITLKDSQYLLLMMDGQCTWHTAAAGTFTSIFEKLATLNFSF